MITKEQKLEIFENIILGLRAELVQDRFTEQDRRLPLD